METRKRKYWSRRSQMQKVNLLANRLIADIEEQIKEDSEYVTIPKGKLKWLLDLVRWAK